MKRLNEPLFFVDNITYKQRLAYHNINIEPGKIHFIVGESGSGKSTLLKLLNNTISPDAGEIFYLGKSLIEYDPISLRRDISLVSQETYLFDESILDNFNTFYSLRQMSAPDSEWIKYMNELCLVNVPLNQNTSTCSGGERQRIYLSIFLSFCPKVILLDEPTSALDEKTSHQVMNNITKFCKEKNIDLVIVSHDNSIVETFAERKIEINRQEG